MQKTIVHLTTVHPRNDARILLKQVLTLAQAKQWSTTLVVADGKGAAVHERDGITVPIRDVGRPPWGRLGRAILGTWRAFREVHRLQADVVHFHDPELIPVGILLRLLGHKVTYDVHEDAPRQILSKHWLPRILRHPTAWILSLLEWVGAKVFDAIVPATPKIAERFPPNKTVIVQNFPVLAELAAPDNVFYPRRPPAFVYVGGISVLRGAWEMVQSLEYLHEATNVRLELAGYFSPAGLEAELQSLPRWVAVKFHGYVSRSQVAELLGGVRAGLVVLHPTPNHSDAYPVKMFEYMAAGLPVIASDFPLWRDIIEDAGCGLLVNPLDPKAIAVAMQWLLDHPEEAENMGRRGRRAVERTYNWERESIKLLALYDRLLGEKQLVAAR